MTSSAWLYNICRGIDLEAVTPRFYSKSIGCCKKFPGPNNITGLNTLRHWLTELADEICDRMEKDMLENNRRAKQMVLSFVQEFDGEEISSSRSVPLKGYDQDTLTKSSLEVLQTHTKQFFKTGSSLALNNPIKFLGISVGKFETIQSGQSKLQEMFANMAAKKKNEADNALTPAGREDNATTYKDTQAATVPVAKKPTFMQNFLQTDCKANNNNATNLKAKHITSATDGEINSAIIGAAQTVVGLTNNLDNNSKPAEVRSFFLNALKKQKSNENTRSSTTVIAEAENNISTTNHEEPKADISKSFFAKFLNKPDIETTNVLKVAEGSTNRLPNTENQKATIENTHVIDLFDELEQQIVEETFETESVARTGTAYDTNATIGLTTTKRKYTALLGSSSPTHKTAKNELAITSTRTPSSSYEASYVEFAVPAIRPEFIQMTKCATCKANIPSDARSLQFHQDRHIAMQLSQQIRDEFRAEVKTKLSAKKSVPSKKSKKSPVKATKAASNKAGTSITKFLKPTVATTSTASSATSFVVESAPPAAVIDLSVGTVQDRVVCQECNLSIAASELHEHKDFHIAKALQRQLNMLEVRTVSVAKKSNALGNNNLHLSHANIKKSKPITQFFSQSNC